MEGAYADLSQTISLDPSNAKAYLFRASMYPDYPNVTMEQALADARKVLELSTDTDLVATAKQMLDEIPKLPTPTPGLVSYALMGIHIPSK